MTNDAGPEKILCPSLRFCKKAGEAVRRLLDEKNLIDRRAKPFSDDTFLCLPLTEDPDEETVRKIEEYVNETADRYGIGSGPGSPERIVLAESVFFEARPEELTVEKILGYSPAYEMIGDIAVIDGKDAENAAGIAEAILRVHPAIRTVLLSEGPVKGEFRTRDLRFIAGIEKTETLHKEYGCRYHIDLGKAYFTQRLSTERARILSLIRKGDFVVDMFAGVGPYSILIAKRAGPETVIANDKNPDAVRLLKRNIEENRVRNIIPLEEDAKDIGERYAGKADHVLMNLPHSACDFLDTAVTLTKPGGVIHYYAMTEEHDLFDGSVDLIRKAAAGWGREIEVLGKRAVRSYAPHQYNICLDVKIL